MFQKCFMQKLCKNFMRKDKVILTCILVPNMLLHLFSFAALNLKIKYQVIISAVKFGKGIFLGIGESVTYHLPSRRHIDDCSTENGTQ